MSKLKTASGKTIRKLRIGGTVALFAIALTPLVKRWLESYGIDLPQSTVESVVEQLLLAVVAGVAAWKTRPASGDEPTWG